MDTKAPVSSLCLFKETRTDLQPTSPGTVIQIQIPSTSTFSVRSRQQRHILRTTPIYKDEDSFNKHYPASSSSVYFGKFKKHPRNFLWRVLQEGKVLELRSVDLSKSNRETREAVFTIQLHLPVKIKHGGVALADSEDQNVLNAFALTKGNELYTFAVPKDFFCDAAASEEDIGRWCKVSKPATFSISTPHSLIAGSSLQLVVSLSDGRLLQLTRRKDEDGSKWHESTYGDGQWASSLRGLVRWQGSNTVRYDGTTLEQSTPIAMAVSPNKKHIFAVCLNHTLRIWNPKKATSVFSKDLLCQHREPHEVPRLMLDPGSPNVLQVFRTDTGAEGDLYYAVTFSPYDFGQFKFWGVRDPDHGDRGVRDLYPEYSLKPPDPDPSPESKAIWKVADFKVKDSREGKGLEMWVLMRSNRRYKLYSLKFEILDLANAWQDQWSAAATETMDQLPHQQVSDLDPVDATDKWLDFIFYPGKYPQTVLESALALYCSERSVSLSDVKGPLKQRMCSAVASRVNSAESRTELTNYRKATDQEWAVVWQDIQDLNKSRWEILSLSYDDYAEMPWIVFADGCSAIRTCSKIELIAQNGRATLAGSLNLLEQPSIEMEIGDEPKLPDELAVIIEAAATFRQSFSYRLRQACNTVLATELWLDASYSVPLRIQAFYDQCNFGEEIGSAPFDDLLTALEPLGGFNGLDTDTFLSILDERSHKLPPNSSDLLHTKFGLRILINGAREMVQLCERILFDLLTLVVFVDMEIDRDETPMENFDAPRIYMALLELLKQYQIMQWLARNTRMHKSEHPAIPEAGTIHFSSKEHIKTSTVLESLFALDLAAQSDTTQSQSEALTHSIEDLLQWVVGGNYEEVTLDDVLVYVQSNLLANKNIDLASDFLRYQPSTAWGTYIKGRLSLLQGDFTEAAFHFKKAAFKLSRPSSFDYYDASDSLLSPMEAVHFGHGLTTYYTHVLNLFDSFSSPTLMAHFAHLALQLSPASHASSDENSTVLTSLFQASLQTTDFSTAYSALIRHPAPRMLLPTFVSSLLTTPNALPQLLAVPFPPNLQPDVDALISSHKASPRILAAWRLHHNDFRGAAAALLPPLQQSQAKVKRDGEGLENSYLSVINLLACAGENNDWVLSEDGSESKLGQTGVESRRKIVTIGGLRGKYQKELDRRSVIEGGRFGFVGGSDGVEMDVL